MKKEWTLPLVALVLTAPVLAAVAWIGAVPTHSYAQDVFFVLNGAWRVLNGQAPHVDFYSPFGPVSFLVVAAGLKLSQLEVQGIGYGIALMGLLVSAGVFRLASRRLPALPALLLTLYLTLLCVTPYPLGMDPARFSHAMSYNRVGYALLCVVIIEAFIPPRDSSSKRLAWLDGVIAGLACALLLFLKASFFLVAAALAGLSLVCRGLDRNRCAGWAAGALPAALALLAFLHFDAASMWSDLRIAAAARSDGITPFVFLSAGKGHWIDLLRLALMAWLARDTLRSSMTWLWLPAVFVSSLLLFLTNNQGPVLPPVDVLVILLAALVQVRARWMSILVTLCLAPVLWQAVNDTRSLMLAATDKLHGPDTSRSKSIAAPHLAGLHFYDYVGNTPKDEYTNGRSFADHINDGIGLVRQHGRPGETIVCPELADPFAYALLRPPAPGGFVLLAHGFTYSDTSRPHSERLFAGADLALLPNRTAMTAEDFDNNRRNFFGYIESNFHLVGETAEWRLLRNNRHPR